MSALWWKTSSISQLYVHSYKVRELVVGFLIFLYFILELSVLRDSMKKEKNILKACSFLLVLFRSTFISSTSCDAQISLLLLVTKKTHTQLSSFVGDDLLKPDYLTCVFSEEKVLSALTHIFFCHNDTSSFFYKTLLLILLLLFSFGHMLFSFLAVYLQQTDC